MMVCVPVDGNGVIDPRWGRAAWIAVAEVVAGEVMSWREIEVSWNDLHDQGGEGAHHARVVRFLRDQGVDMVVAEHMGAGMAHTLETMGVQVRLGATGDARAAVLTAATT